MSNVVGFAWSYVFEDRNPNLKREKRFIFEWFTSSIKHRTRKFHIVVVKVGYTYDIVYVELTKTIWSFQVLVALAVTQDTIKFLARRKRRNTLLKYRKKLKTFRGGEGERETELATRRTNQRNNRPQPSLS